MGIDRIGKGGGVPPGADGVGDAAPAEKTGKTFEIGEAEGATKAGGTASAAGVTTTQPTALDRLRAGEVDVNGYIDLKVDAATAHLKGLPVDQMESIRSMLRSQIATDPMVKELFEQAIGQALPPPPDE